MTIFARIVVASVLLTMALASSAEAAKRVALVIGNSSYKLISPLTNPKNDADLMALSLKELGFEVIKATDVDVRGMGRAVKQFGNALRSAGKDAVGLFYYAGHGVQSRGENYLVPLNAEVGTEFDLDIEAMSASDILGQMESAGNSLNIVILDACRNNPFKTGFRSATRGFARVHAPSGSLVAFSAAPGQAAVDGKGKNSPYTAALANMMRQPGLSLEQVFKRVRVSVEENTGRTQTPWEESSLRGDFYFVPRKPSGVPQPPISVAATAWNAMKDTKNAGDLEVFIETFPNSFFAKLAASRLTRLQEQKVAVGVFPEPDKPVRNGSLKPGDQFRDCADCPKMVVMPAGSFMMGSPASEPERSNGEGPQRKVTISKPFAVGKFEVTFAEWDACVSERGCSHKPYDKGWGRDQRPVIDVSWRDVKKYVAWLIRKTGKAYRLLSEAEWEYSARAGTSTPFSTGQTISTDQANFAGNDTYNGGLKGVYRGETTAVGSFAANSFGLHDMHGNVEEWVEDCRHVNYVGAPDDGSPWTVGVSCSHRVFRGGSWIAAPSKIRSAVREYTYSDGRSGSIGFRIARMLTD